VTRAGNGPASAGVGGQAVHDRADPEPAPSSAHRPLAWASARTAAYAAAEPLAARPVRLADALGATLAEPVRAVTPLPAFDAAAMDGYAVGSERGPWRVVGRVLAGDSGIDPIEPDEAVEIGTGAAVPKGTVAVLSYERSTRCGPDVEGAVSPDQHVRRVGEDAPGDADLVGPGALVTPPVLGLAAMVGLDRLQVRPRPRVTALLTGNELIHSGPSGHGKVRDAVGPQLPGLVGWLGGELAWSRPVPDTPAGALREAVSAAATDVVVTCGGAAHGPSDRLREVLRDLGARTVVPSVACRPGHPQHLALLPDGRWLVGLPGNPYAALVAALTLLGPLLAGLAGRPLPTLPLASLAVPAARGAGTPPGQQSGQTGGGAAYARLPGPDSTLTRLLPVRWAAGGTVEPVGRDRPANLWGAAIADALAVVRPGWTGQPVPLLALPTG
jgi:molybdopterin molybdotransferase